MAKECMICGRAMGVFTVRVQLADASICIPCWLDAGFEGDTNSLSGAIQYSLADVKERIAVRKQNQVLIDRFQPTKKVGKLLMFDDNTQSFVVQNSNTRTDLYYYNQLVDFELLEDGESITKGGLGRAVAGGLLFGGVGAIVGGVTGKKKTKGVCNSMQIKLTLRNSLWPTVYLPFVTSATKTNGLIYKNAYRTAQEALSALQLAVDQVENAQAAAQPANTSSGADEILKYKQLLDSGIITEEEFQAKKRQLLGI